MMSTRSVKRRDVPMPLFSNVVYNALRIALCSSENVHLWFIQEGRRTETEMSNCTAWVCNQDGGNKYCTTATKNLTLSRTHPSLPSTLPSTVPSPPPPPFISFSLLSLARLFNFLSRFFRFFFSLSCSSFVFVSSIKIRRLSALTFARFRRFFDGRARRFA